ALGAAAAAGRGAPVLAVLGALVLVGVGAYCELSTTQAVILAALLFVPDMASGTTLGFRLPWSSGLTLTNFVIPALAVPLLAGAWLAGRRPLPRRWPGLATGALLLLGWGMVTLVAAEATQALSAAALATVLAHWSKLVMFVVLGAALAAGDGVWQRRAPRLLLAAIVANAAVGLAQMAGLLQGFSPLARGAAGVRASGLFYDANMYGVLCAWALLWLVWRRAGERGGWGWDVLALAVAANLVGSGSRAGYGALAAGCGVLLLFRCPRPVVRALALLGVLAALFPLRSVHRVGAAVAAVESAWAHRTVAAGGAQDAGTSERLASMREGLRQIAEHPLFGVGFGRALYLGVPQARPSDPVRTGPGPFRGAQNMLLTVWAAMGPLGLLLFLAAIAAPLRQLRPSRAGYAALPMLAGFAGLLVASLTIEALWNARVLALVILLTAGAVAGRGGLGEARRCEAV
ncbi:MAG: O-antigen ligase family protein, partial [Terriglobales bacterium]